MTQEDKAKAYDEAIERANKLQKTCDSTAVIGWCEYIFPELKESEDEKIRKALIKYFTLSNDNADYQCCGVYCKDIVDWLEKQDDKPQGKSALEAINEEKVDNANKVEPKDYSSIDPYFGKPIEQNPAWSEEDKDFMYDILNNLSELKDRYGDGYGNVGRCIDWILSLKERDIQPQNTWKPSEEQIKILQYLCEHSSHQNPDVIPTLESLYKQLKALV